MTGTRSSEARPFYSPKGIARILARSAAKESLAPLVGAFWAVPGASALFGRQCASSSLMAMDCFSRRFTISSNTFFMTPPFRSLEFPLFLRRVKQLEDLVALGEAGAFQGEERAAT
jgi:hypothetical protein